MRGGLEVTNGPRCVTQVSSSSLREISKQGRQSPSLPQSTTGRKLAEKGSITRLAPTMATCNTDPLFAFRPKLEEIRQIKYGSGHSAAGQKADSTGDTEPSGSVTHINTEAATTWLLQAPKVWLHADNKPSLFNIC